MKGDEMIALVFVTGVAHLLSAFRFASYQRDDIMLLWHALK